MHLLHKQNTFSLESTSRGFTLIELLVVIAIIGVLSAVILASLNTAAAKARDAERISNIKSLESALQMYYDDNGSYPNICPNRPTPGLQALAPYLVPKYIPSIPIDPTVKPDQNGYCSEPAGYDGYGLYIYTEVANNYCRTGVNVNTGWWGSPPTCNF